jgi:hypothetical protein
MVLPTEYTVFKGSKEGAVVKQVLPSKSKLEDNEVAIKITHSGVRQPTISPLPIPVMQQ